MQSTLDFLNREMSAEEQNAFSRYLKRYKSATLLVEEIGFEKFDWRFLGEQLHSGFSQSMNCELARARWVEGLRWIHNSVQSGNQPNVKGIQELQQVLAGSPQVFRCCDLYAGLNRFISPDWVDPLMRRLATDVLSCTTMNPFEAAGRALQWIKCIHPYQDGNARLAVAVRNWVLSAHGLVLPTHFTFRETFVGCFPYRDDQGSPGDAVLKTIQGSLRSVQLALQGYQKGMRECV